MKWRLVFPLVMWLPVTLWSDEPKVEKEQAYAGADVVKVAAVQVTGYGKSAEKEEGTDPVEQVLRYVERAARDQTALVVFPEYHLGRIRVPGKETERIGQAAARHRIYVIVGSWEVFEDGSFANAALLFGRDGKIIGKYYKTHAAIDQYDQGEGVWPWTKPPQDKDQEWFIRNDPEWIMKKGDEFPVFDLDFGRVGILTCYDGWFPEPFRILSLKGAEIIVWINGRYGSVEDYIVRTNMHHNFVSMICTNQAYGSGTMIAEWPSTIKALCKEPKEDYITAEINLKQLRQQRRQGRSVQQRRPEIYGDILRKKADW